MVRCQRCAHNNEPTAKFCVGCGQQLPDAAVDMQALAARSDSLHSSASAHSPRAEGEGAPQLGHGGLPEPGPMRGRASAAAGPNAPPPAESFTPQHAPGGSSVSPDNPPPDLPSQLGIQEARASALPFAETAPPVLAGELLNRPVPDRGVQQQQTDDHFVAQSANPVALANSAQHDVDPLAVPKDAPRVLAGFLVSYDGNALGQSWTIHQGGNLIGRLGAIIGADIELPHATVSSSHAMIHAAAHPGRIVVLDKGSTNGTFVNETALQPDQHHALEDGDRIRFGLFTAIVKVI